jgi:hypothetical protein
MDEVSAVPDSFRHGLNSCVSDSVLSELQGREFLMIRHDLTDRNAGPLTQAMPIQRKHTVTEVLRTELHEAAFLTLMVWYSKISAFCTVDSL